MAKFMEIKSMNPKSTQKELAKELRLSTSSLQRYRQDKNLPSPYGVPSNSHKRKQRILNREHDLERLEMNSNDLK